MHTHSEQLNRKNVSAQRWSIVLLGANFIGAFIYVIAASRAWVIPQEREAGLHSVTGEPFIWAMSVIPIWSVFFLLNLTWGAFIIARRQQQSGIFWLLTIPVWVVAMAIDFTHHSPRLVKNRGLHKRFPKKRTSSECLRYGLIASTEGSLHSNGNFRCPDQHTRIEPVYVKRALCAFLVLGVVTCTSQTRREKKPLCDQHGTARVQITDPDATILGFTIGHASLKDVQAKLGMAEFQRVSHADESDVAICYVSPIDHTVLVFYSGAMGGWEDVTWFALWSSESAYKHSSRCSSSTLVVRNLATSSGLRLGLTKGEVEEIAGKPTKDGTSAKYDYLCRQRMTADEIKRMKAGVGWDATDDPYFDRVSWIEVRYLNSAASRLEIGRIESY